MFSKDAQQAAVALALIGILWTIITGIIAFCQFMENNPVSPWVKKAFWYGAAFFFTPVLIQLYSFVLIG